MCGISGIFTSRINLGSREEMLRCMVGIQNHRGPDDFGFYHDEGISLGHNRLSIIDLAHGKQPIYNEDKSLVIVYNGEIYNFREIRDELMEKGHLFSTKTDTEVIVHAFEEWGESSFSRFNGMFAFALWDIAHKKLYLGRDRFGIKPLYVYMDKATLFFASEIKAFSCIHDYDLTVDTHGLIQYLCFQNYYGNSTLYKDVKRIEPGCVYRYDADLEYRTIRFYDLQFSYDESKSFAEWTEEFGSTFHAAVERHLIADVRVGSYLSGGFDSTLVSWVAQKKILPERLLTFNGYFADGSGYDESFFADRVASEIHSEHHKVLITSSDFKNEMDRIIYHLDEPMMGPGSFAQYVVAREISKEVKVVLTGHGGDEFFAGYPVYKAGLLRDNALLYANEIFRGGKSQDWIRLAYFVLFPLIRPLTKYGLHILFPPSEMKKLLQSGIFPQDGEAFLEDRLSSLSPSFLRPYDRLQNNYLRGYLQGLFMVEDKISMAHSLESRTPICDNTILSLSLTMPAKIKLYKGQLKAIIKEFGRNKLPAELYNQPKRGFPTPIHLWFKGELRGWMQERLFGSESPFFNRNYLEKIWKDFLRIKRDGLYAYNYGCKLFSVLCLILLSAQEYNGKRIRFK